MTKSAGRKRALKVIGLMLCLMTLAFWVFSVMYVTSYAPPGSPWSIGIVYGRFGFEGAQEDSEWICIPMYSDLKTPDMTWIECAHTRLGFALPSKGRTGMFHIPVWMLLVAVGFPTAILWWRDRRPQEGCCKTCKYDLTGNISGICPECGTAIVGTTKTNDATTPTGGA